MGKEGNRLEDRTLGLVTDVEEYANIYVDPERDDWAALVLPVLCTRSATELAVTVGLHHRTVERILAGRSRPHPDHQVQLGHIADELATSALRASGLPVPRDRRARLHAYRQITAETAPPRCAGCGAPLTGRATLWCSDRCRNKPYAG